MADRNAIVRSRAATIAAPSKDFSPSAAPGGGGRRGWVGAAPQRPSHVGVSNDGSKPSGAFDGKKAMLGSVGRRKGSLLAQRRMSIGNGIKSDDDRISHPIVVSENLPALPRRDRASWLAQFGAGNDPRKRKSQTHVTLALSNPSGDGASVRQESLEAVRRAFAQSSPTIPRDSRDANDSSDEEDASGDDEPKQLYDADDGRVTTIVPPSPNGIKPLPVPPFKSPRVPAREPPLAPVSPGTADGAANHQQVYGNMPNFTDGTIPSFPPAEESDADASLTRSRLGSLGNVLKALDQSQTPYAEIGAAVVAKRREEGKAPSTVGHMPRWKTVEEKKDMLVHMRNQQRSMDALQRAAVESAPKKTPPKVPPPIPDFFTPPKRSKSPPTARRTTKGGGKTRISVAAGSDRSKRTHPRKGRDRGPSRAGEASVRRHRSLSGGPPKKSPSTIQRQGSGRDGPRAADGPSSPKQAAAPPVVAHAVSQPVLVSNPQVRGSTASDSPSSSRRAAGISAVGDPTLLGGPAAAAEESSTKKKRTHTLGLRKKKGKSKFSTVKRRAGAQPAAHHEEPLDGEEGEEDVRLALVHGIVNNLSAKDQEHALALLQQRKEQQTVHRLENRMHVERMQRAYRDLTSMVNALRYETKGILTNITSLETEKDFEVLRENYKEFERVQLTPNLSDHKDVLGMNAGAKSSLEMDVDQDKAGEALVEMHAMREMMNSLQQSEKQRIQRTNSKRDSVMKELLETEKVYVRDLGAMIDGYITPVVSLQLLSPEDRSTLCGGIEDIYEVHQRILNRLQLEAELPRQGQRVAQIFLDHMHTLSAAYCSYCARIPLANKLLNKLMAKGGDLAEFLEEMRKTNGKLQKLSLGSFLIKPMQRITKYPLLLKELMSSTAWSNASEVQSLIRTIAKLRTVLLIINLQTPEEHPT